MHSQVLLKYPFVFLAGFLATYLLTPLVSRLALSLGMVDLPGERRIHTRPTPRGGGIAVFVGFHVACGAVMLMPWDRFRGQLSAEWWWSFFLLSSLLLVIGLIDDFRGLKPLLKLAGQVLVAILAFLCDMRVGRVLETPLPAWVDLLATVLWFVTIINAFNLMDGIDGLVTGLAAIASVGLAGSFLFRHRPGDALILLGLVGSCLAFLRYNFQPASVFLGDSGSMFLGFTLAAVALPTAAKGTAVAAIAVPLLALGLPVFDVVLAVWRRSARRLVAKSDPDGGTKRATLFTGDLDHMHHRLIRSGLSHRAAASWLYGASMVLVGIGLLSMIYQSHALGIWILAFVAGAFVIVRHLARVELWDSGVAILSGFARPPRRSVAVLLHPLLDCVALALALGVAVRCAGNDLSVRKFLVLWVDHVPLWVGLPFLCVFASRAYSRVWTRARISEYLLLGVALLAGITVTSGIVMLTDQFDGSLAIQVVTLDASSNMTVVLGRMSRQALWIQALIYASLSLPALVGLRMVPRAVQDAMSWSDLRRPDTGGVPKNILIVGAGYGCMLFLLEQSHHTIDDREHYHVAGLLDDDRNLHGRTVLGFPVLGSIDTLADMVRKHDVTRVVMTDPTTSDKREELSRLAEEMNISLVEWKTESRTLVSSPTAG